MIARKFAVRRIDKTAMRSAALCLVASWWCVAGSVWAQTPAAPTGTAAKTTATSTAGSAGTKLAEPKAAATKPADAKTQPASAPSATQPAGTKPADPKPTATAPAAQSAPPTPVVSSATGSAVTPPAPAPSPPLNPLNPITPVPVGTAAEAPSVVTTSTTTKEVGATGKVTGVLKLLLILGVFVVPIVLANYLSRRLRMPDYTWRFFFVLLSIIASTVIVVMSWPPKLGIDLRGGVILVYEVNKEAAEGKVVEMDRLIGTIKKRLDPSNVKELNVRPFGVDKVEVIIPNPAQADDTQVATDQDELERIKKIIAASGSLEFRILASTHKYQNVITKAQEQQRREESQKRPLSKEVRGESGPIAKWVPIKPEEAPRFMGDRDFTTREVRRGNRTEYQALVVLDPYDVTGDYLTAARKGTDERGQWAVLFSFNIEGSNKFFQLTSRHTPDAAGQFSHLGIILDDFLQSAPRLNEAISSNGQISGSFTEQEVDDLSEILTAGALPAALNKAPVSEQLVGATLGEDTIASGVNSMLVAVACVVVFMVIYYRFAGVVANFALVLNVTLTVAFMMMFNAAFTLAGLAGLALTVGMAVDANVLIYERMREELARGATLRMAIRNGFDRASVTIIDANLTTLITAVILYLIGTDQIKGFAVTLTVGIMFNLFTAITVSRLIFELAERNRWVSNLKFMQILSQSSFDFIGKRYAAYALSILMIGAGLVGVVVRGSNLLNIDFTGGVSVVTVFDKAPAGGIAEIRREVERALPEATVQELKMKDKPDGSAFKIVTSDVDKSHVEGELKKLFGADLAYYRLTPGKLELIAAAPAASAQQPAASGPALPAAAPKSNESSAFDVSSPTESAEAESSSDACDPQTAAAPSADAKPAATKPAEAKPAEAKVTATATKPADAKPTAAATSTAEPATVPPASTPSATAAATGTKSTATADAKPSVSPTATASATAAPAATPVPAAADEVAVADPFAGGTRVMLHFEPEISHPKLEEYLKQVAKAEGTGAEIPFEIAADDYEPGSARPLKDWELRIAVAPEETKSILSALQRQLVDAPFFPSSENVGAAVAAGAKQSAAAAMVIGLALVLAYVWFRFQNVAFGFAAIVALVHDVLFTVGMLALSLWLAPVLGFLKVEPFKIDLTIVAALLTIIGYSINDTIVIFDRIREVRGKSPGLSGDLINLCVNQTLSRTILTSLTVFLVVLILYIWGGPGIHGFAFALVVGTISGTYSTIYVASPVLLWLHRRANAAAQLGRQGAAQTTA